MPELVSGTSVDKQANEILAKYKTAKSGSPEAWYEILRTIDLSKVPVEHTQKLMDAAYSGWEGARPFLPAVDERKQGKTNLTIVCEKLGISVEDYHAYSLDNPRKWVVTMLTEMVPMPIKDKNGKPFKLTEENLQHVANLFARDGKIDYEWVKDGGFNPANIFERNAQLTPGHVTLTNRDFYKGTPNDKQYTNKERFEAICQAANFLREQGVKEGQYIPFITRANDEHDIMKYAAMAVGAIPVMLPSTHSPSYMQKDISQFSPERMAPIAIVQDYSDSMSKEDGHNIADSHPIYSKFKDVLPKAVCITKPGNKAKLSSEAKSGGIILTFDEVLEGQSKTFDIVQRKTNDTFLVIGSSGTTETRANESDYHPPKMIGLNGSHYWDYAMSWNLYANLNSEKSLQQVAGPVWMMQELSSFGAAANNSNYHMTDAALTSKEYWQSVADHKLEDVVVSPAVIEAMRKYGILDGIELSVKNFYVSGGKPNHDDMLWLATRVKGGARVFQVMGGTEQDITYGAGPNFTCYLDDTFTMLAPTREVYIAKAGDRLTTTKDPKDKDGINMLAADTEYFILFQPKFVPTGLSIHGENFDNDKKYHHPSKTVENRNGVEVQAREHGDGIEFVPTPDRGPIPYCTGRVDDKLKISGEDISPEQLESCVKGAIISKKLLGVSDVIVTGAKNPKGGQQDVIYAVLVNDDEAGKAFQSEDGKKRLANILKSVIKENLPTKVKVDGVVIYTDKLPRTDNGKPKRKQIQEDWKESQKTEMGYGDRSTVIAR